MSLTLFWGHLLGVDYDTLSSGDGVDSPDITAVSPTSGQTDVLRTSSVIVTITNVVPGVIDPLLTIITVKGVVVWSGDVQQNGWTGVKAAIGGGYRYTLTPPTIFVYGDTISVIVYGENDLGLFVTYPYSFFIEHNLPYPLPPVEDTETHDAIDMMFPFVFKDNCDVPLIYDSMVVEQNMRLGVLINRGGVPFKTGIGSHIIRSVMDLSDESLKNVLGQEVKSTVDSMGLDVMLSMPEITGDEGEMNISAPYRYMRNNKGWKVLQIPIPYSGTVS